LGGRIHNLDEYGFYIDDMPGIGMPPILHQTQAQPMLPGSLLRGFKTKPRVFDLIANQIGTTHEDLHSKRKDLLNAIKPDLVLEPQSFILRYTGANSEKPIEIRCVYDSGYQFTKLDGFTERQLPLRFISYDEPYFYEIGDVAQTLTAIQSLTVHYIIENNNGTWSNMNVDAPTSATSGKVVVSSGDYIYFGGLFTGWDDGISNADYIARYNKNTETWGAVGTGLAGGAVETLLVAPNGDVYLGGYFTSAGGVANTGYIAKWNGSDYEALGTGMNDQVYHLAIDNNGNIYAGGNFTSAGGVADTDYFAKWDGSSWSSLGVFDSYVQWIEIDKSDNLYVGGNYSSIDADGDLEYITKYDGSTWSALGSGVNNVGVGVWCIEIIDNGLVYVGGAFTTAGGNSANYIASWNGSSWSALGDGLNNTPMTMRYIDGSLYCVGGFTTAGGLSLTDRIAVWNGSTWAALDLELPGTFLVEEYTSINGIIYLAFYDSGTATSSYSQTITNNGTRSAYPKIVFKRSGGTSATVRWIKNETTGATIY
jgi:hypothetical protein